MTIDLGRAYEEQLQSLAKKQGREIGALILEAVREYLEAAAITDLSQDEVAKTQLAMLGEIGAHCQPGRAAMLEAGGGLVGRASATRR